MQSPVVGAAGSYQDIVKNLEVSIINTTAINLTARISLAGGGTTASMPCLTTDTRLRDGVSDSA